MLSRTQFLLLAVFCFFFYCGLGIICHLWKVLKREVTAFISCRLATGILDIVIMFICVDVMEMHALLMKVISNVLVIILNYIFSKLVIFKKK